MKSGRPHRVPLPKEVIALLDTLPRFEGTDLLFPGRQSKKPLSDMAMTKVMRDMKLKAVPHGFRSTFSSWCASSTSYPSEVREMALAHVVGDSTVSAYQRSDLFEKRRHLMADWAKFVTTASIVGDNIISLHGGVA
jgi:integrase